MMLSPFLKTPELHLSVFKGPFDLLFELLRKGEIEWKHLPLLEVAYQFEGDEIEEKSSFLTHFVQLLWLKTSSFFPKEQEEVSEISTHSILDLISTYQTTSLLREKLEERESYSSQIYHRMAPIELQKEKGLTGVELTELALLFQKLLDRHQLPLFLPEEPEKTIGEVLITLLEELHNKLTFDALFSLVYREQWIPRFLALLEGIKQEKILLYRDQADLLFVRSNG